MRRASSVERRFQDVLEGLQSYRPPADWPGELFLLPPVAIRRVFDMVVDYQMRDCLELGTGFGTTACFIAAALEEIGGGKLVTIDLDQSGPVNVSRLMDHLGLDRSRVEIVADPLGYNWHLAERMQARVKAGEALPHFDFCLLDGAHEWEPDGLAFTLAAKLLRPGGWLAVDDLDFRLRQVADRPDFAQRGARELDCYQMRQVWELLVRSDANLGDLHEHPPGRLGWARKLRPARSPHGWIDRLRRRYPERLKAPGAG